MQKCYLKTLKLILPFLASLSGVFNKERLSEMRAPGIYHIPKAFEWHRGLCNSVMTFVEFYSVVGEIEKTGVYILGVLTKTIVWNQH